jgi:hypothetical protein
MPSDPGIKTGRYGPQGENLGMETGTLYLTSEMLKPCFRQNWVLPQLTLQL